MYLNIPQRNMSPSSHDRHASCNEKLKRKSIKHMLYLSFTCVHSSQMKRLMTPGAGAHTTHTTFRWKPKITHVFYMLTL